MRDSTRYERVEEAHGFKYILLKSGRKFTFWNAIDASERAESDLVRAVSRCFKLAGDGWDLERLEWRIDRLEEYVGAVRAEIEKRRGQQSQRERIALLRNTTGRTEEEAAAFRAKADELEARLSA